MIWLSRHEQIALIGLGVAGLAGVAVLAWQQSRDPVAWATVPATDARAWDAALASARQIDINTATVAELERLPLIGPALAARIVADREAQGPFATAEDLARVKGIGPKTLAHLAPYLTVGSE